MFYTNESPAWSMRWRGGNSHYLLKWPRPPLLAPLYQVLNGQRFLPPSTHHHHHHHHHHLSLNREGPWGTTDDFATSFLHFFLSSIALWDLPNSRLVHFLMLSSHLFLCLPCLLSPFTVPCKMVLTRPDERKHDHTTAVCVSLQPSRGLHVVQLPAGSWHGLPRW